MTVREEIEKREHKIFSPFAAFSDESKGRKVYEEHCDLRTVYQRDRDRILHCKSFRRLKHKTQVFLSPYGDHYRTRLTHTLEVSQIARTIARSLRLNEDLTEAIALGHDIGHTPFGHAGERALTEALNRPFFHNEQSVRVLEKLEKEVAYISHDIDDGIRADILKEEDIPADISSILGHSTRDRINNLIHDAINNSMDKNDVSLSKEYEDALLRLREFMFKNLYTNMKAKSEEIKATKIIRILFEHYMEHTEEMSIEFLAMIDGGERQDTVVCDYIAGMTDNYAIMKFQDIYVPHSWNIL